MINLVKRYERVRELYSASDFEKIFEIAAITAPAHKSVAKDLICAASAVYLDAMATQEARLTTAQVKQEIQKARKASAAFTEALRTLFAGSNQWAGLTRLAVERREQVAEQYGIDSDTYAVVSSIFPFDKAGHGFRQTGLENALTFLNGLLEDLDTASLKRQRQSRALPLRDWVSVVSMLWFLMKGKLPAAGHYDPEVAEYGSAAVHAFTLAIQAIDRDATERMIVDALHAAKNQFEADAQMPFLLYTSALTIIISSGQSFTHKQNLFQFLSLPTGTPAMSAGEFESMWGAAHRATTATEQSFVSEEQFIETLYSEKPGNKLLQALIALREK